MEDIRFSFNGRVIGIVPDGPDTPANACIACALVSEDCDAAVETAVSRGAKNCVRGNWHFEEIAYPKLPVYSKPLIAPAAAAAPEYKQTNPKDVVGVRKAPMSTVSAAVLAEVGVAMLEGALKYGRHNYRAVGVRASVYYDGTMRHLMDWWEGVDIDPDSGMHHITKAITSLVVLRDAMIQGKCEDDRPPRSRVFYSRLNEKAAALMDKYADCKPKHYTIEEEV